MKQQIIVIIFIYEPNKIWSLNYQIFNFIDQLKIMRFTGILRAFSRLINFKQKTNIHQSSLALDLNNSLSQQSVITSTALLIVLKLIILKLQIKWI